MKFEKNISLAGFTTLGVSGSADFFARVKNVDDVREVLAFAVQKSLPIFWLGGGSNLFFADAGFRGLVAKSEIVGVEFANSCVRVGGGLSLATLVNSAVEKNLAGFENLAAVPGTVGGAIAGNANAIGERLISAEILTSAGEIETWQKEKFEFAYRNSALKNSGNFLLTAEFQLEPTDENLREKIATLSKEKIENQVYKNTAGSWFKNPPKNSAWKLIDEAGCRGMKVGGARVSEKHSNFFENFDHATANDFLQLEEKVVAAVEENSGVRLEREVIFVPEKI